MSIEITKAKLQKALHRLEEVIDHKINSMEYEITSLKAENNKLKNLLKKAHEAHEAHESPQPDKTSEPSTAKRSAGKESKVSPILSPSLLNPKVVQDIDQTISRLKKLVE